MTTNYPIDLGTFPMYRGDAGGRNKVTVTLNDANGYPVDLTVFGTTWKSQAAYGGAVVDLTVDVSNAATGVVEVRVPDNQSASLPAQMRFDVQVTGGTISPLTLFSGRLVATGEVTT